MKPENTPQEKSSSKRIRLIKLLRTHGLKDLEHLREDELRDILHTMKLRLSEESFTMSKTDLGTSPSAQPSSHTLNSNRRTPALSIGPANPEVPMDDVARGEFDDPDALPRFREPKISLPEGQRSFLRLIPVDAHTLFVTWDLSEADRNRVHGRVRLHLMHLDKGDHDHHFDIDLAPGGWYLPTQDDGARLQVNLLCEGEILLQSNEAVVPPQRPALVGPVVYASLSPHRSRRDLGSQGLLDAIGEELEGIVVEVTDEHALIPDFLDANAPDSHRFLGNPSSHTHSR